MPARIQIASLFFNIEGDTDDLQKGVKEAEKIIKDSFGKMASSGGQVIDATDNLSKSMENTGRSSTDLAAKIFVAERAYGAIKQAIAGAVDMAQLGASMERVEDRFGKFAQTAGGSTKILEAFQKGAGGTVDQMSAMTAASALLQQGLVTNAFEMEKTVELATRLGSQTVTATDRINDFSQLLRNQSIQLLDNFGISSGVVRTRIKELQAATAGLSREEAFRIAVFEEGEKSLAILGERVDDNAAKFERAQARLADWRLEMAGKFTPVVASVMEFISELDSVTIALVATLTAGIGTLAKFTGGLGELATKVGLTGGQFAALAATAALAIAAYEGVRRVQEAVAEGQENVNQALETWIDLTTDAADGGEDVAEVVRGLAQGVEEANEVLHANGNILEDVATAYVRGQSEADIWAKTQQEATKAIILASDSLEEANSLVDIYNDEVEVAAARIGDVSEATFEWLKRQQNLNQALSDGLIIQQEATALKLTENVLGLADSVFGLGVAEKALNLVQEESNQLIEERAIAMEEASEAAEEAAAKTLDLDDALKIVNSTFGGSNKETNELLVSLGKMSEEERKVREDLELLTRAWEDGVISRDELTDAIREAEQGTLDLEFAQRKSITEGLNQVIALEEQEKALEKYKKELKKAREEEEKRRQAVEDSIAAQVRQAETLKDASQQEIARAAIGRLEKAQEAGIITFDQFTQAVVDIQDQFGLADKESRAVTLGLGGLTTALSEGILPTEKYGEALAGLIEDAEDGEVALDRLLAEVIVAGEGVEQETQRIISGITGEEIEIPIDVATQEIEDLTLKIRTQLEAANIGDVLLPEPNIERLERIFDAATSMFAVVEPSLREEGQRVISGITGEETFVPRGEAAEEGPSAGVQFLGDIIIQAENLDDFLAQLNPLMVAG